MEGTYNRCVKLEVVGLVKDSVIEVVQRRFSLQRELMERVKGFKSECSFGAIKSRREPAGA